MNTRIIELPDDITPWGFIPQFINPASDKPLWEQIHDNYGHGGGWSEFDGFEVAEVDGMYQLQYPGDPPYKELSRIRIDNELLVIFSHSWVLWKQDDEHKIARID